MGTAIVIGAGSGIGSAVAARLAGVHERLVLADVDVEAAERVASGLPGDAEVHRCDLTSLVDVAKLVEAVGGFDALVVTAGLSPTMAPGQRIVEVDLVGPALTLEAFEGTALAGSAALVVSSMAGHLAPVLAEVDAVLDEPLAPDLLDRLTAAGVDVDEPGTAYSFAKRGVLRLVRRLAVPWGARGARLLSLSPGIVDTPMGRRESAAQPMMEAMVSGSPLGRQIAADEVAAVAAFLVSDAASAMTGTDVLVDGGAVAAIMP